MFNQFYSGKRVLLTGHTGFKGSWLALWLTEMGAEVHGLSLAPEDGPSLHQIIAPERFASQRACDTATRTGARGVRRSGASGP